jgi:PAS domain S-box-containing protein/putative nucleotidyltransferase with HDIG domain
MPLESVVSKMHPDDIDRVNRVMEESMTGDRAAWLLEYRFRHKDGQYHWLSDLFTVVRDEQGHPLYLVGNVHDITERKRAEEALRESERRLKEAQAMGRIGDWKFDIDNQKITWSDQVFELYERDPGLGAPTPEEEATYYSPEQARILREYAHRSIETGQEFEYDLEVKLPSGRTGYFSACMHPIKDESGRVVELFGTVQDITKRKRAEEALRESEERYRSLFDRVPVGLYRTTPAGQILDANPALVQMLGYPDQESLLAVSATDVYVNGRDRAREQALLEREEVVRHFETQMCRRDGAVIWVRDSVRAVRNADDRVLCYEGSLEDITKRKRAEEALRASETEKKAILNAMSDIVLFHNADLSIQWGNEAARRSVGKTQQEVVGCYCYELWHGRSEPCERCPVLRALETGSHADGIMMTPDGRWWEITGEPVCDRDGKTVGAIEIAHDITKRKRTEEALRRHLERVEALREIDRAITSTLDLTEVLDVILGELKRVIPYHSAGIFLLSNGIARLAAGRGFPDLERVLQVSLSVKEDPLTREVLQKKRPLVLADAQADERFRARGGTAYVRSWIGVPMVAKGEAIGFLTIDHREPGVYDEENAEIAQGFASQAAIAIENARLYQETQRELAERKRAEEELQQSFEELRRAFEGTVTVLMSAVEMRDPYTAGHQRRVTQLACAIANEMALPQEQIEGIRLAGLIHDIGKINVPAEILSKPSQLTDLEFGLIKMHPQTGHNVLRAIEFPWPVAQIVLQHHERMNGSGYPQGLSGEEIILEAKILGVADVVEAMASHRPYRAARGIDEALEEISQNRDTLYDPKVVDACLRLFTEKGFKFE